MCKSDSIFPCLQSSALFTWLLKFISWWVLSQKWMITVFFHSVNVKGNWTHLTEKNW